MISLSFARITARSSVGKTAADLLEYLAAETWATLADATFHTVRLSEETLTEANILSMKRQGSADIDIYQARGLDEQKYGFDYEFYIRTMGGLWARYSVQAKKIHNGKYRHLRHKVGARYQIDLLEDFARSQNTIPLFCFYNCIDTSVARAGWRCVLPYDEPQLGCTVVPLHIVRHHHEARRRKSFAALHNHAQARPWRCLIRCPYLADSTYPNPLEHPEIKPRLLEVLPFDYSDAPVGNFVTMGHDLYTSQLGAMPRYTIVIRPQWRRLL